MTSIKDKYSKSMYALRIVGEHQTEWFGIRAKDSHRCGWNMSPDLFNLILKIVMRLAKEDGSDTGAKLSCGQVDNSTPIR